MRLSERRALRSAIGSPRIPSAWAASAALRVASRSASGLIVTPLQSDDITCKAFVLSASLAGAVRVE
jgi:hypothetical protein